VSVRRAGVFLFVLMGLGAPLFAVIEAQPYNSSEPPVVQRFLSRPDEPLTRYRALRRLEAQNNRFNMQGWLDAWTELTVEGRFEYEIVREGGSEYIRNKVLRPLLENEEKLFATTDASRSAVTPQNYDLRGLEAAAEPGLVKLFVKPKRRDVSLIDGAVFVTEDEADLVRVEGRLAKNPSFWTKRVDVVRRYDRIGGMRVPVRLDSVAQVRLAGTSTLSMTWDYETINGERVAAGAATLQRRAPIAPVAPDAPIAASARVRSFPAEMP
jgi:hypothetical protein